MTCNCNKHLPQHFDPVMNGMTGNGRWAFEEVLRDISVPHAEVVRVYVRRRLITTTAASLAGGLLLGGVLAMGYQRQKASK